MLDTGSVLVLDTDPMCARPEVGRPAPSGRTRARRPGPSALEVAVVVGAVVAGAAERFWVGTHSAGALTSDGSVIGLMALGLLHHGHLPAYMWGQSYAGSLEAVLTAAVFAVFGVGTAQLLATTALANALATLALWRTGRHLVGPRAARLGALAFWVFPVDAVWRSLKPGGSYMVGLALALCAVGALVRLKRGDRGWGRWAVGGLWCGMAFWTSPMSLQLLLPALLWCAPVLVRQWRRAAVLALGALVGAIPVWVFAATHHLSNFAVPGGGGLFAGFGARLVQFFTTEAPMALSLKDKGSPAWIGGALGFGLYMAAVAAMALTLVWVLRGRAARCRLPVLTLALLPGLFALNHMANHPGQARYVLFGSTMASLLLGVGLDRLASGRPRRDSRRPYPLGPRWRWARVWPLGLAALAALGWGALRQESPKVLVGFDAPDVPMPVDDDGLIHLLETHHIATAYANYWIAYRATFETRQATVVTPFSLDRYPPFAATVRSSADPAYLFVARSTDVGRFVQWCEDHGVAFSRWTDAGFTVIQPVARILPSEVPRGDLH